MGEPKASVKTAVIAVVFAELSVLTVGLIVLSIAFSDLRHEGLCFFLGTLVAVPTYAAAGSFMLWGASKEIAWWLLPHLIIQGLTICISLLCIVLMIFNLPLQTICQGKRFSDSGIHENETSTTELPFHESSMTIATLVFFSIFGVLQVWFMAVALQCYVYLSRSTKPRKVSLRMREMKEEPVHVEENENIFYELDALTD